MNGFVDTSIIVDILRGYLPANAWYAEQDSLGVSVFIWMEVVQGAGNLRDQQACIDFMVYFDLLPPQSPDITWSMTSLSRFHLSHNVSMADCLIASICARMQVPLYTRNLKHMRPLLGELAVNPY